MSATTLTRAAELLERHAADLKDCHTLNGEWGNDHDAREAHDAEMALAGELRAMLAAAPTPPEAPPAGWKLVLVPEDVGPEPDWDDVRAQVEEALGLKVEQHTYSIIIRDVLAERRRQIEAEGWTPQHDDEHDPGELAAAAAAYALAAADKLHPLSQGDGNYENEPPPAWPWTHEWWKPDEPRRMIVKACALGLAEIERMDRAALTAHGGK